MPISDKTRKILWGRSGNRCAICRQELVVERTSADSESVIGMECHIVAEATRGPRHVPGWESGKYDDIENLLLLCGNHHKQVDDQAETYTVEILKQFKANHERWVAERLTESASLPPVRIKRIPGQTPPHLSRVASGKDLLDLVWGTHAHQLDFDEPKSSDDGERIGAFLQEVKDWGDLSDDLEPFQRVQAVQSLSESINQLEATGYWVFAGRETQRMEGGTAPPSNFYVALITVLHKESPKIVRH